MLLRRILQAGWLALQILSSIWVLLDERMKYSVNTAITVLSSSEKLRTLVLPLMNVLRPVR